MSELYQDLLDATIRQLELRKAEGGRFICVSREKLAALASPQPQPSIVARPRTVSPPQPIASGNLAPLSPPASQIAAPGSIIQPAAPQSEPSTPALSREAKEAALAALRAEALACRKCPHLAASRKNVVFGVGDIHSPLMFVGEAPGADEDQQGEPFVGAAGQLLTKMIQAMGFTRQSVYIANILKCRPDTPGESFGNRKPMPEEMKTCLPYLLRQIELIRPRVIVALGATAVEGLFGKTAGITRLRGTWHQFQNTPVMPTYHPAYLLRNQAVTEKRKVWEDLLAVMVKIECAISDKQRGYFLRGTS